MPQRFYTVEEANTKVPSLEAAFARAEGLLAHVRELQDQMNDLEIVWGSKVLSPDCPDREEYERFKLEHEAKEAEVDGLLKEVTREGIEIKDVFTGLVDFYAKRGAEIVYLCWRKGEPRVGWWHTLTGGFAGRRPIEEF